MTPTAAHAPRFSLLLRRSTRGDHRAAEGVGFMDALLDGSLGSDAYGDLIGQMWLVYSVLEEAVAAHRGDRIVGPFHDPNLERRSALETDLAHLFGPDWASLVDATDSTVSYRERLREVADSWPMGLVAHHYTRYLGDLSGGQTIGRILGDSLGLGDGPGVCWFAFPGLGDLDGYKERYRARLDALDAGQGELDRLVEEVKSAYELNRRVLDDLGERHLR